MKKIVAGVALLALLAVVGWQVAVRLGEETKGGGRGGWGGPGRGGGAIAVETAPVARGTVRDVRDFPGTLNARSSLVVTTKVGGRLERIFVDVGDRIERGAKIAVLDDEEYGLRVEQARAELEVAGANLEEAKSALEAARREYERAQALEAKKISSESELDAAKAQFEAREARRKVAEAQVSQREAALKAAEVQLRDTTVLAVWEAGAGDVRVVGERFVEEGAILTANAALVSVQDIAVLEAAIHVPERDLPAVRTGLDAVLSADAFPGRPFPGKVTRVSPLLQESSRKARIEIEIPNPEGLLKPGMFVQARLEFARHDDAVLVPLDALTKRDEAEGVFVVDEASATARFVAVKLGLTEGRTVEVLEPALSGRVVTLGAHLLRDGSALAFGPPESGGAPGQGPRGGGGPGGGKGAGKGGER